MTSAEQSSSPIAEQHRAWAEAFGAVVRGTTDWDAPTPVQEWQARDVVRHLVEWPVGLLRSQGSTYGFPDLPSFDEDPVGAWEAHAASVQALLEDDAAAGEVLHTRMAGDSRTDEVLERFYLPDVYMHTWDLARASGQDDRLDEGTSRAMHAGMKGIEPMLRESGQFGQQQPVADDATETEKLMAFLGRRPDWRPPA